MIGGLIEEQDVGLGDEGFGNGEAFEPAAAEAGGLAVHAGRAGGIVFSKAGAAESLAKALLAGIGWYGAAFERRFNGLTDGEPRREAGYLMHVADAYVFAERNFAGVRLLFGAEDREECGFACAVGTDKADAVTVVDGKGNVIEERMSAEAFGDVLRDQDRRHVLSLRSHGRCYPNTWGGQGNP